MIALKCLVSFICDVLREKTFRNRCKDTLLFNSKGCITIGYADKVLLGKTYNRTVCVNKLMHKTLNRFLLNKMEDIEASVRLTGFSTTMNWHCHEF